MEQKEMLPPLSDLLVAQRCFFSREYRAFESADIRVYKKGESRERKDGRVSDLGRTGFTRKRETIEGGGRLCAARNNRREAVP